ncbi:MAG: ornithine carbamoyltransferase [Deltaproteobacteria bacterium]|nr:ornithine carbamoyltransferase [Deltaproteobacteria bacterium]
MKDLLSIYALTPSTIEEMIGRAKLLKQLSQSSKMCLSLQGKTLGMIFEKSSTRTRLSFEVGMTQLGGTAIFISSRDTQIARGESLQDTAKIFSRYLDAVVIRTFAQQYVDDFANYAEIPVINGLTDLLHPCQILSDIFTLSEIFCDYSRCKVAYIGDGNNIANSWINLAAKMPINLSLACPKGYEPNVEILARCCNEAPGSVLLTQDPFEAAKDADVLYTDVWASMGQEEEQEKRIRDFMGYRVDARLLQVAKKSAVVMHCLPAHRGEEISADVIDGKQSIVFQQAENRLHLQKAILEMLMIGGKKGE